VGAHCLELEITTAEGQRQRQETPFEAAQFDPRRPTTDGRLSALEARGEALWTAAFSGSLGLFLEQAAGRARDQQVGVTLQIVPSVELPEALHWLPWEVLFDRRRDYLSLKSGWSVVRGVNPFVTPRLLHVSDLRVRVLVLSDGPEADDEVAAIRRAFAGREDAVEAIRLRTAGELLEALAGDATVVHVIGAALGEGVVVQDGEPYVGRTEIAAAVAANDRIGLMVFNGARTAQVAEEVHRRTSVTVLAHRNAARAPHAGVLSSTFYRNLLAAIPADVALTEARRAVDRRFAGQRAWTGAVLLTGWPPLALDHLPDADRPPGHRLGLDTASLTEMMHRRNRERARELLEGADWDLVRNQLQDAEHALREFRPT
jgi:hypothetical protein